MRALRILVGGSPRAMALLFPFLRSGRLDDVEDGVVVGDRRAEPAVVGGRGDAERWVGGCHRAPRPLCSVGAGQRPDPGARAAGSAGGVASGRAPRRGGRCRRVGLGRWARGWGPGSHGDRAGAGARTDGRRSEGAIEAVREHPDHHKLRELTGLALWQARRGSEALPHAEWLVERYPEVVRYRRDLVDILVHLDRSAEALEVLQRAPQPSGLQEPRIEALAAAGRWDEAAELAVKERIQLAPVVEALRSALRGKPIPGSVAVGDGALMTFSLRQVANSADRSAIVRRLEVFRTAVGSWRAVIELGLTVALAEDAAFRLVRPGWRHVVDALGDLGILHPRFVAVARAMLSLPDPAPFLRLAASERAWIRAVLADSDAGRALPVEPR